MLEPGKVYQVGDTYLMLDNIDLYMDTGSGTDRRFEFHQVYPALYRPAPESSWMDKISAFTDYYNATYGSIKLTGWPASKSSDVNKEEEPENQDEWIKLLGES